MDSRVQQIQDDFDRIALVTERYGLTNDTYHDYLIRQVPAGTRNVLEVGCGTGAFTRQLALQSKSVVAVDLSPQMIRLAGQESINFANIEFVRDDIMRLSLTASEFDCIVTLATVHHLPLKPLLVKLKSALEARGVLIIHDLVADDGPIDTARSALAYPASIARRVWKTGRLRSPAAVREAWDAHGTGESYLTMNQVREMCAEFLPGAAVQRHLLWRYTVIWRKP